MNYSRFPFLDLSWNLAQPAPPFAHFHPDFGFLPNNGHLSPHFLQLSPPLFKYAALPPLLVSIIHLSRPPAGRAYTWPVIFTAWVFPSARQNFSLSCFIPGNTTGSKEDNFFSDRIFGANKSPMWPPGPKLPQPRVSRLPPFHSGGTREGRVGWPPAPRPQTLHTHHHLHHRCCHSNWPNSNQLIVIQGNGASQTDQGTDTVSYRDVWDIGSWDTGQPKYQTEVCDAVCWWLIIQRKKLCKIFLFCWKWQKRWDEIKQ